MVKLHCAQCDNLIAIVATADVQICLGKLKERGGRVHTGYVVCDACCRAEDDDEPTRIDLEAPARARSVEEQLRASHESIDMVKLLALSVKGRQANQSGTRQRVSK